MTILAIDAAMRRPTAGFMTPDGAMHERAVDGGHGALVEMVPLIAELADAAGLPLTAVNRIAVTCGPGSFTGLRVALAAASGLGCALGCPVVGVPTLDTLARAARGAADRREVLALVNSRRRDFFTRRFDSAGNPAEAPRLRDLDEIRAIAAEGVTLAGDLAEDDLPPSLRGALLSWSSVPLTAVAALGRKLDPQAAPPHPLYLREPSVTPAKPLR